MSTRAMQSVLLLFILGCSDQGSQPARLAPGDLWHSHRLHNYTIDQVRMCFCEERGQTMRVVVRADTVAMVLRASDDSVVAPGLAGAYLTIDSLFTIIRNGRGDSIVVSYNEEYGYPERLDINPQLVPVDAGVSYTTSNLRVP